MKEGWAEDMGTNSWAEALENVIIAPNELHVRQHLCQSLFKSKTFLLHFWIPLLTKIIKYVFPCPRRLCGRSSQKNCGRHTSFPFFLGMR